MRQKFEEKKKESVEKENEKETDLTRSKIEKEHKKNEDVRKEGGGGNRIERNDTVTVNTREATVTKGINFYG